MAGHPVAGVDGDVERAQAADVDERAQELPVVDEDVAVGQGSAGAVVAGDALDDLVADRGQAGVLADGFGAGAAQLDPVVGGRVVAGGEHRAGAVQQAGGEIELVGGGESDAHDVEALVHDAFGERGGEHRGTGAHVVAEHDLRGVLTVAHQPREGGPDLADECVVDFLPHEPTNVIGLDHALHRRGGPGHRAPWTTGLVVPA